MKKIIILFILTIFSTNSFAAGSESNSTSKVKSNYDKAVTLIKAAKKYEKKGKIEKANKINEYLGELYVVTNRLDLAKERLKVLESCNCEEYTELKEIIDGTKQSKY